MDEKKIRKQFARCFINFKYTYGFIDLFNKINQFNCQYERNLYDVLNNIYCSHILFYKKIFKDNFVFAIKIPDREETYLYCEVLYNQDGGGVGIDIYTLIKKIMMEKYNEKFKNHFPNFDTDKKYSIVIAYDMSI
jgi:hypothetical protein